MERTPATAARQMCRHLSRGPVNGHFGGAAGAPKRVKKRENAFFAIFVKKWYRRDIPRSYGDGKSQRRAGETRVFIPSP